MQTNHGQINTAESKFSAPCSSSRRRLLAALPPLVILLCKCEMGRRDCENVTRQKEIHQRHQPFERTKIAKHQQHSNNGNWIKFALQIRSYHCVISNKYRQKPVHMECVENTHTLDSEYSFSLSCSDSVQIYVTYGNQCSHTYTRALRHTHTYISANKRTNKTSERL